MGIYYYYFFGGDFIVFIYFVGSCGIWNGEMIKGGDFDEKFGR